jgi:hypothetical protein
MKIEELIALIKKYDEWQDDLDESACPTGFVYCPVCEGGGFWGSKVYKGSNPKYKQSPSHRPDCPRVQFELEHGENND